VILPEPSVRRAGDLDVAPLGWRREPPDAPGFWWILGRDYAGWVRAVGEIGWKPEAGRTSYLAWVGDDGHHRRMPLGAYFYAGPIAGPEVPS